MTKLTKCRFILASMYLITSFGIILGQSATKEKLELVVQNGHPAAIGSIAFSPDGKFLATVSGSDNNASTSDNQWAVINLWELKTGRLLRTFSEESGTASNFKISFSPSGETLAFGDQDATSIILWNIKDGGRTSLEEITRNTKIEDQSIPEEDVEIGDDNLGLHSFSFSPDGTGLTTIVSIEKNKSLIKNWNVKTRRIVSTKIIPKVQLVVATSNDGRFFVDISKEGIVRIWDMRRGQIKQVLPKRYNYEDYTKQLGQDEYNKGYGNGIVLSPDGKFLALSEGGEENSQVVLWDVEAPKMLKTISDTYSALAFTNDGKILLDPSFEGVYELFDIASEKIIKIVAPSGFNFLANSVFSPVGDKIIASGDSYGEINLFNLENEKHLFKFQSQSAINSIAVSPAGDFLATSGSSNRIFLWDLVNGSGFHSLKGHSSDVWAVSFNSDGKVLASGSDDGTIRLWDVQLKNQLFSIGVPEYSKWKEEIRTIDPESPGLSEELKNVKSYPDFPRAVLKTETDQLIFEIIDNNKVRIVYKITGKELASLVSVNDKDWLVSTPEGLFDGSPYAWKQIIWRFNNDAFNYAPVEAFFNEFYYPGLLQAIISGKRPKPLNKDLSLIDIRQPVISFTEIGNQSVNPTNALSTGNRNVMVKLEISDNNSKARRIGLPPSSGAKDLRLFRNGSLVRLWRKDIFGLGEEDGCQQVPATPTTPRKAVCQIELPIEAGENTFTAYAFNNDNVKSNDADAAVIGANSLKRQGTLYVLAVGVNKYFNPAFNLKYAVADVEAIGKEIVLQQSKISDRRYAEAKVISFIDERATKANVITALKKFAGVVESNQIRLPELEKIESIEPEDVLIIYFAGHGLADKDRFYLVPHDGIPTSFTRSVTVNTTEQKRLLTQGQSIMNQSELNQLFKQSISDLELEELLETVNAGKMIMVIDACNSGQALEAEEKRRGPMNSRGLAQLAYEKGMNILTASQSFQSALEATKLNHGLLTYALLEGLKKGDANNDKSIIDREWLDYGVKTVPQLQIEARGNRLLVQKKESNSTNEGGDNQLQTPRVFYRREIDPRPLIISLPQ